MSASGFSRKQKASCRWPRLGNTGLIQIMRLTLRLCTLLLVTAVFPLLAANWPAFRGPHEDGLAEQEKPPTHFNQSSNLLWKVEVLPGLSSPVIWKDRVFLTCEEGNKLSTVCFEADSGRKLWDNRLYIRSSKRLWAFGYAQN